MSSIFWKNQFGKGTFLSKRETFLVERIREERERERESEKRERENQRRERERKSPHLHFFFLIPSSNTSGKILSSSHFFASSG